MGDQKNLLVAIVLSIAILFTYQIFYEMPRADRERAQQQKVAQQKKASPQGQAPTVGAQTGTPGAPGTAAVPGSVAGDTPSLGVDTSGVVGATTASPVEQREAALKSVPRITIDSTRLEGSLSLKGARIDDLSLRGYRETIEKDSPLVELLQPLGTSKPYYAEFGWLGDRALKLPNRNSVWTTNRDTITPGVPVTLSWDNGDGLVFEQRITLDENYMFTVTQRVRNNRTEPVTLAPYGLVSRTGTPSILGFYILHEGLVGVLNETLTEVDYSDLTEDGPQRFESNGGWLGITDKYWLTALIPDQKQTIKASFNSGKRRRPRQVSGGLSAGNTEYSGGRRNRTDEPSFCRGQGSASARRL